MRSNGQAFKAPLQGECDSQRLPLQILRRKFLPAAVAAVSDRRMYLVPAVRDCRYRIANATVRNCRYHIACATTAKASGYRLPTLSDLLRDSMHGRTTEAPRERADAQRF